MLNIGLSALQPSGLFNIFASSTQLVSFDSFDKETKTERDSVWKNMVSATRALGNTKTRRRDAAERIHLHQRQLQRQCTVYSQLKQRNEVCFDLDSELGLGSAPGRLRSKWRVCSPPSRRPMTFSAINCRVMFPLMCCIRDIVYHPGQVLGCGSYGSKRLADLGEA